MTIHHTLNLPFTANINQATKVDLFMRAVQLDLLVLSGAPQGSDAGEIITIAQPHKWHIR